MFKSRRSVAQSGPLNPAVPPDTLVWAVGDIHGRVDLMVPLVNEVVQDIYKSSAERRVLIFLGDYIDRGPNSDEVMDVLVELSGQSRFEVRCLRGNHEDQLMAFIDDPEAGPAWCEYGGRETLSSYGVRPPSPQAEPVEWREASIALGGALPTAHSRLLGDLEMSVAIGDYFFAHAGARPRVALEEQDPVDLMWIRNEFLKSRTAFDQIVVHGHTPSEHVYSDHRRIGIDTGAYATGILTALRLEGPTRAVLQTVPSSNPTTLRRQAL